MKKIILCFSFALFGTFASKCQVISTIAGNGAASFGGDGGTATAASFNGPNATCVSSHRELYVSDGNNNRIRKIDVSSIVSTIAGRGPGSFSGDGGPATAANLFQPSYIVFDTLGNLYVGDRLNNRVRKIDTNGIISTFAGNGGGGSTGDGGPATAATIDHPYGLVFDHAGNLLIAEEYGHVIRKVSTTGQISTFAGTRYGGYSGDGGSATAANLNYPNYLAIDGAGNVYVTDNSNHRVRKIDTSGIITTVIGNGLVGFSGDNGAATAAEINFAGGITVDSNGNLYLADCLNNRIRKLNTSGVISTIAGTGTGSYSGDGGMATAATMNLPIDVRFDGTNHLLVTDFNNRRVRSITLPNNRPHFLASRSIMDVCQDSAAKPIGTLASAIDSDYIQHLTWTITVAPMHGSASGFPDSSVSRATFVSPRTATYHPNIGYVGLDSFTLLVTDGIDSDRKKVIVNITDCHLRVYNDEKASDLITVYPNPSDGRFHIDLVGLGGKEGTFVVSDICGRKLHEGHVKDGRTEIELNVAPGVYFLSALISGQAYHSRIVVH